MSQKTPKGPSPKKSAAQSGVSPMLIGGLIIIVLAIGGVTMFKNGSGASESASPSGSPQAVAATPEPSADVIAKVNRDAAKGPHKQASLPPIPFRGYEPPRAPAVVTAAYEFAAEHPEVSGYVPCFCGCEAAGHNNNADCFVTQRADNGDVIAWEEHGVECAVCIDVATRSRQMQASGASVSAIRDAVEKEFSNPNFPNKMATPKPPSATAANH